MKIDASSMSLAGSHSASVHTQVRETLHAWIGDKRPDFEKQERATAQSSTPSTAPPPHISSTPDALLAFLSEVVPPTSSQTSAATPPEAEPATAVADVADAVEHDPMLRLLKLLIETMTGRKVETLSAEDWHALRVSCDCPAPAPRAPQSPSQSPQPKSAGFGIEYDRHVVRTESEQTHFATEGVVRTTDGREIRFQLALDMGHTRTEETQVSLRAGDGVRKDPLVVNFDGSAAQLQDAHFSFDLDGDGQREDVPLLAGNRGYLAFDANGNGKIDSGRELFGPASGDGFSELAHHDSNGNGWIDENDTVFDRLLIWTPAPDGGGSVQTAKERGIGAFALAHTNTPFELRSNADAALGVVRSSGVYLMENGSAGSLQQIDVVV